MSVPGRGNLYHHYADVRAERNALRKTLTEIDSSAEFYLSGAASWPAGTELRRIRAKIAKARVAVSERMSDAELERLSIYAPPDATELRIEARRARAAEDALRESAASFEQIATARLEAIDILDRAFREWRQRGEALRKALVVASDVLDHTHFFYCGRGTPSWIERGMHAPECLLEQAETARAALAGEPRE